MLRLMKSLDEIPSIGEKDGYIDVLKRTREYFKAPGVFRLLKGQWDYLYPEKEEKIQEADEEKGGDRLNG